MCLTTLIAVISGIGGAIAAGAGLLSRRRRAPSDTERGERKAVD